MILRIPKRKGLETMFIPLLLDGKKFKRKIYVIDCLARLALSNLPQNRYGLKAVYVSMTTIIKKITFSLVLNLKFLFCHTRVSLNIGIISSVTKMASVRQLQRAKRALSLFL